MSGTRFVGLAIVVLGLAACGERPQTAGGRSADAEPWTGAQNPFVAPGWKPGDKASWEQEIHGRMQNQNEYRRMPAKP